MNAPWNRQKRQSKQQPSIIVLVPWPFSTAVWLLNRVMAAWFGALSQRRVDWSWYELGASQQLCIDVGWMCGHGIMVRSHATPMNQSRNSWKPAANLHGNSIHVLDAQGAEFAFRARLALFLSLNLPISPPYHLLVIVYTSPCCAPEVEARRHARHLG